MWTRCHENWSLSRISEDMAKSSELLRNSRPNCNILGSSVHTKQCPPPPLGLPLVTARFTLTMWQGLMRGCKFPAILASFGV